ncbi:hypothetical protein ABZY93_21010 [Streptomyces smyrnaeus]|uniref:hypothetical protein n=1 Tax=Streptomyces smyrnaeus TaxID=1387713 RepID=UPI0033AADAAB
MGRAAGRRSPAGSLRPVALLCAALALACAAGVLVAGAAVYHGRDQRGAARAPQYVPPGSPHATVAVKEAFDNVAGGQRSVIYVEPLKRDAPLPPGIDSWPKPGEAWLSPALAHDLAHEGGEDRYGAPVGAIAASGLEVPGERLAYVRARDDGAGSGGGLKESGMLQASGFGGEQAALFGDRQQTHPRSAFLFLATGMLLFPALALTVIAARCGSAERDRRMALIRALGAPAWARAALSAGESLLPVTLGTGLAVALTGCAMATDWRIPYVAFTVPAADLRRWAPQLFTTVIAAGLAALLITALLNRQRRQDRGTGRGTTRPRPTTRFRARRLAWLCPLFILLAIRASDLTTGSDGVVDQTSFTALYLLGVVGALATLPAVLAVGAAFLGRRLATAALRRGRPAALVAGRWMQANPGTIARLCATIVIAIGLAVQVQLHSGRLDAPVRAAMATQTRLNDSVVTIRVPEDADKSAVDALAADLPEGTRLMAVTDRRDGLELTGSCHALRVLGAPCRKEASGTLANRRVDELSSWSGHPPSHRVRWTTGSLTAHGKAPGQLLAVSEPGTTLPLSALKRSVFHHLPSAQVLAPGEEFLNTEPLRKAAAWTGLLGTIGVTLLGLAGIANKMGDFLHLGRAFAPLSVLAGRPRIFWGVAAWGIAVPMASASVLGALLATVLASPLAEHLGALTPPSQIVLLITVTLALVLASWLWASVTAVRAAERFTPTGD